MRVSLVSAAGRKPPPVAAPVVTLPSPYGMPFWKTAVTSSAYSISKVKLSWHTEPTVMSIVAQPACVA
jgi:hypothetical protein